MNTSRRLSAVLKPVISRFTRPSSSGEEHARSGNSGVDHKAARFRARHVWFDEPTADPYTLALHSVLETSSYLADAKSAGMDEDERLAIVLFLSMNPMAGDIMQGTGGARKIRFKRAGIGKSGGYRIVSYYAGADLPVFLLNVFVKGDRANLSKAEQNALSVRLAKLPDTYLRRSKT